MMAMSSVSLLVCPFFRLFVCYQRVLMLAGAYRVGHAGRTSLFYHKFGKCISILASVTYTVGHKNVPLDIRS